MAGDDDVDQPPEWCEWLAAPGTVVLHDGRRVHVRPGDQVAVVKTPDGTTLVVAYKPRQPHRLH